VLTFCIRNRCAALLLGALALAGVDVGGGGARAEGGRLEARYTATLAGVALGNGAWHVDVREDRFTAAVSGVLVGVVRLLARGRGASASQGSVANGQPVPSSYSSSIETDRKYDEVRMQFSAGNVTKYVAEPPNWPNPDRVPLADAHRRGVKDPMTASMLRVPGNGNTFVPQACDRKISVFDGRMRYDVQLVYKRLDRVRSIKGYRGTVVVCAVYFSPIAGHVPSRASIKYLKELRDIELWLAPIAGTRLMVPYRVSLSTPLGQGVVQATQFVTVALPAAAANKNQPVK
jgi:hypothetical protein